jgi:hypothetical protein
VELFGLRLAVLGVALFGPLYGVVEPVHDEVFVAEIVGFLIEVAFDDFAGLCLLVFHHIDFS